MIINVYLIKNKGCNFYLHPYFSAYTHKQYVYTPLSEILPKARTETNLSKPYICKSASQITVILTFALFQNA